MQTECGNLLQKETYRKQKKKYVLDIENAKQKPSVRETI